MFIYFPRLTLSIRQPLSFLYFYKLEFEIQKNVPLLLYKSRYILKYSYSIYHTIVY